MNKPHVTSVSNLSSWLTMAAQIYPPQQVALVGAGNGAGPLVQWLQNCTNDAGHGAPAVILLEPHAPSMAQLAKRLAVIEECADWQLLPDMLAPEQGKHVLYQYSLAAENSLLPLDALRPLWPGLLLQSESFNQSLELDSLLPASWLLVDCLPAANLLQATTLPACTQVVLARVVLADAALSGTSLADVQAVLKGSGFKAVAAFEERNRAIGKVLFVRDPSDLQEHIDKLQQEKEQVQKRCDELAKANEAETVARQAEVQARAAEQQAKEQALAQVQQLRQEKEQVQKCCDELARVMGKNESQIETIQTEIVGLRKLKDEWAEINKNPYAHNRVFTGSFNSDLHVFANKNLGLQHIKPAYLDYLASKAQQLEKNCIGRLATTVQDAVTRQLVVECLTEEKASILEIGALYGIGMAMLYNHAITRVHEVRLICLDPFDGYYGKAVDALLNQPVNDLTFRRNMKLANVPESDYSIVKRYSTDPLALEEVNNHAFNLLIIDGDHSYQGVKYDFEKFFPLLEKGGYVIFDDYNAKEWPGVQKFIDEDLKDHANLQYLGAFSRTAVGRKLY